jgi:hypothetical protein
MTGYRDNAPRRHHRAVGASPASDRRLTLPLPDDDDGRFGVSLLTPEALFSSSIAAHTKSKGSLKDEVTKAIGTQSL